MQSVVFKTVVWLFAEVVLTAIGTDDLADYGEYVFKIRELVTAQPVVSNEYVCANGVCTPRKVALNGTGPFAGQTAWAI